MLEKKVCYFYTKFPKGWKLACITPDAITSDRMFQLLANVVGVDNVTWRMRTVDT